MDERKGERRNRKGGIKGERSVTGVKYVNTTPDIGFLLYERETE